MKTFLGTGWSFPPTFDEDFGNLMVVSEDEDIRQSLYILLSTTPGERITNPKFGCDLHSILFRPSNAATDFLLRDAIQIAVLNYEPRIDLDSIHIDESLISDGIIQVTITYIVRKTNSRHNLVFPFYKVEGTNISEEYR